MQVVTIVVNGVRHIPYRSPTISYQRQVLQKSAPLILEGIQCLMLLLFNILFVINRQGQLLPVQYELSKSNRDRDLLIQQAKELQETQVLSLPLMMLQSGSNSSSCQLLYLAKTVFDFTSLCLSQCTALHCTKLYYTTPHYNTLQCTALHRP